MVRLLAVTTLAVLSLRCGDTAILEESQRQKLDPQLQQLLAGRNDVPPEIPSTVRPDGTREYTVLIRTNNIDDIRAAGVQPQDAVGNMIIAKVSLEELLHVVRIKSVLFIYSNREHSPQRLP
jgi:hypothetical protein